MCTDQGIVFAKAPLAAFATERTIGRCVIGSARDEAKRTQHRHRLLRRPQCSLEVTRGKTFCIRDRNRIVYGRARA